MNEHLRDLEALAHGIPLAKRRELGDVFNRLAASLQLSSEEVKHLTWPTPSWPSRGESSLTRADAFRYLVDFGYGDRPDHRNYLATFEEVRRLLKYTVGSCKVAFGTGKGKVDRTERATRLGPCVIHRLPDVVDISKYPEARRLQDRENDLFAPATTVGGKRVRFKGNKY